MEKKDPTFEILEDGHAIRCRVCGMTSHNSEDVAYRYCGNCKQYHAMVEK